MPLQAKKNTAHLTTQVPLRNNLAIYARFVTDPYTVPVNQMAMLFCYHGLLGIRTRGAGKKIKKSLALFATAPKQSPIFYRYISIQNSTTPYDK
jgi:hypothetical protein